MFISFVWSKDFQAYKQTCYLFQYPSKIVTGSTNAKIKIGRTENNDKEILLVIANFNLVAKEIQKLEYYQEEEEPYKGTK